MASKKNHRQTDSGSPSAGEPEYLIVGRLRRAHGVHGDLLMEILTDFPERLVSGSRVYIGSRHRGMVIGGVRNHHEGFLVKFEGIDTPEAAGIYRNQPVFVSAGDRPPLPPGMYYHHQLIGFAVVDETDRPIGSLTEILQTGANDIYVVTKDDGGEVLLPVIASVVLDIDPAGRKIHVHLLPGLLEAARDDAGSSME